MHAGGMPRIPRLSLPGVPLHVVQRGNNRQVVFFTDADYAFYLDTLFDSAARCDVSVHAYVCMTNHVHLLITPGLEGSASKLMQRLGSLYTANVNSLYQRTGSLWEGSFKSSLIDSGQYLLACHRYIELNPVRAGMVTHPANYRWSSYCHNAVGLGEFSIRPHAEWVALGPDASTRRLRHAELVASGLTDADLERMRYGSRKGLPTGSTGFKAEVEAVLAVRLTDGHRGRPRKGL